MGADLRGRWTVVQRRRHLYRKGVGAGGTAVINWHCKRADTASMQEAPATGVAAAIETLQAKILTIKREMEPVVSSYVAARDALYKASDACRPWVVGRWLYNSSMHKLPIVSAEMEFDGYPAVLVFR